MCEIRDDAKKIRLLLAIAQYAALMWKDRTPPPGEVGKDEDSTAVKDLLRTQYADAIRESKRRTVVSPSASGVSYGCMGLQAGDLGAGLFCG